MSDFPLAQFIAFVESKPADEEYDYDDCRVCALTQFAESLGGSGWYSFMTLNEEEIHYPREVQYMAVAGYKDAFIPVVGGDDHLPRTFGALAERLRAL